MAAATQPLRSVIVPKQARSQETLYRLLDAAESLIEEKGGLAGVSVPEIVRRAGSSVGGFYARFRDKNELLRALEERFFQQLRVRVDDLCSPDRWSDARVPEIVGPCVEELVASFLEHRALIAAFLVRATTDPDFIEDALRFRQEVSERFGALLLARSDELRHPEPALALDLGVQLAFALMQQHVLFGETRAGGRRLSREDLIEQVNRNFLAYIGADDPTLRSEA